MIGTVDDHEFADGAWRGGSDNHDPERGRTAKGAVRSR